MKILKIRIKNINSLKDEHEIDFSKEPLSIAGLFAITGVTGSGKTTILDSISLALYNRVPRIKEKITKNVIEKSGLILTRNMPEGHAEVVYECANGVFLSKWSVSSTRNGNIRDYEMEIAHNDSGVLLDLQKRDVPEKNAELIGLSYEQFVRAIILAQGDFATFLKSKEDERGKLLEQITGGEIYRELGKRAFEMNRLHGQELEEKKNLKQNYLSRLIEEEDYKNLINQLGQSEQEIKFLQEEKEKLQFAAQLKTDIENVEKRSGILLTQKEQFEQEAQSFESNQGRRLAKHQALLPVYDKLSEWKQESKKVSDNLTKIERIKVNITEFKNKIAKIKKYVIELTNDPDSQPMNALALLEQKVNKLDSDIDSEMFKFNENVKTIEQLTKESGISFDSEFLNEARRNIEFKMDECISIVKSIEKRLDDEILKNAKQKLIEYRSALKDTVEILKEQEFIIQFQEELAENAKLAQNTSSQLNELPGEIDIKSKDVKQFKQKIDLLRKDLEIKNLRLNLEEHRKNLQPGQACPLCGSLEHPFFIDEIPEPDEIAGKIQEAEKTYNRENNELIFLQSQLKELDNKKVELHAKKSLLEQRILERSQKKDDLLKKLPAAFQLENVSNLHKMLEEYILDLEDYIEIDIAIKRFAEITEKVATCIIMKEGIAGLRAKRAELFSGRNFSQTVVDIRENWTRWNRDLENAETLLSETTDEQESLINNIDTLSRHILPVIKSLGYADIKNVYDDLLSTEEAEKLRKAKDYIEKKCSDTETEIRINNESLATLKGKDTGKTKEAIEKETEENLERYNNIKEIRDALFSRKGQQEENKRQIDQLEEEIKLLAVKNEKWNLLNKYIGDAEGKKFSTFAQKLTLYQLIQLANKRLKLLDDRYLLDLPAEEEDESLCIVDLHMGELRRSVKSLSGGETFLISLALALALSDLASRKIELKCLFIDEGFGSLDKLTLDQTIDTLEKLQYESGKNIGVISHVEAMQERITTQIKVSKNGQGFSKLEIA